MEHSLEDLLNRTALLMNKGDIERARTLGELREALDNSKTNKARGRVVLDDDEVIDVLLDLAAKTRSADVAGSALGVLRRLAQDGGNAKRLFCEHPSLVPVAMRKLEFRAKKVTDGVQVVALSVLQGLAADVDDAREMVTENPELISLLVEKAESDSEQVPLGALGVLSGLACNKDNAAEMMVDYSAVLLSLLVDMMAGSAPLPATQVVYHLSCSPAHRAILRWDYAVIDALVEGRENGDEDISFFSFLALVNLFGAEEDSEVLETNLAMLQEIFKLIARAMNKDGWDLNAPLLAFRYLCVVEDNRELLWSKYGNKFLTKVLAALQRAIEDENDPAAENAVSTLAQFSSDPEPLAWMRSNKPQLDEVIDQLALFPEALQAAQFLQLTLDPPKVVAAPAQVVGLKPMIFISYNWTHQAQARLIHSLLEDQGCPVWRGEQRMNILDALADAVSKSTVVLVLVSSSYKECPNCQMECQFAHRNNRKLIPVLVEPGYVFKADGWLGLLLGYKYYYDVSQCGSNKAQMKPVILELLRNEVEVAAAASNQKQLELQKEIRQWLAAFENGSELADKLIKEELVSAEDLERLSKKSSTELISLLVDKVESNLEQVQVDALDVLLIWARNVNNKRVMVTENSELISLLMEKVESSLKQVQMGALSVLNSLAANDNNARDMVTKSPELISLLVDKVESKLEQTQINALSVLNNLAMNVDNARDIVTKNPTLVPLLVAKVGSKLEQVRVEALGVLQGLAFDNDYAREMVTKNPTLIPLLVAKVESKPELVQVAALEVLQNLALNIGNRRVMVTQHATLVPLLLTKVESNSERVQIKALEVLNSLAYHDDNSRDMLANYTKLLSLLVAKMSGNTALPATKVVYKLSCFPVNRAILRGNNSVVAALTKGREYEDTSFFSLLALVNLFGAEEDAEVLKMDLAMLQEIFKLIARAMNKDGWPLNSLLLAFRYLCVVEHNRELLWNTYASKFLTTILAALQRAIDDKDAPAAENAVSTLAQFSNDPKPLVWMRSNKPQLDEVIDQLESFPEAFKTAQFLLLAVDPPKVVAAPVQVAGSKPTIMISYNWKHQAQARLIHSLLKSQGYPVWRDEEHMTADIIDGMVDAVSKSTVVLVLVSPSYKESVNCQKECKFADNNNRKLIPVLVEPGYVFKADGWLGFVLGTKLYYDVSGFHNEAQMESEILRMLRSEVEGGQAAVTAAAPPVAAVPKQSVPQNEKEIRQWLSKHKHGKEVADKLIKEELVSPRHLEKLSRKSWTGLKMLIDLNAIQALTLEDALKELF